VTRWRLITDDAVSASFGLSADDCLAHRVGSDESEPTLRLYTYRSHCALVGRFQNVDSELNRSYCKAHGITVNRRPTGGGAIMMGEDQLGIALCIPGRDGDSYSRARELMAQFSEGVVGGLQTLGVEASFRGKNDIEVKGRKLVGLGIYRASSGGLLFHASVLVGLDIALMLHILKTPFEKISDKVIANVADRVTTVRREIGRDIELDTVRERVAEGYCKTFGVSLDPRDFTVEERTAIDTIERDKYLASDWVNQTTAVPDAFGSARVKTPGGLLDVHATLAGNTIKAMFIGGDFFAAEGAVAALEASLRWHSADPEKVAHTLARGYADRPADLSSLPLEALQQAVQKAVRRARKAESVARADPYACFVNPGGGSVEGSPHGQGLEEIHV
jgi:lipoate-protein ligase A